MARRATVNLDHWEQPEDLLFDNDHLAPMARPPSPPGMEPDPYELEFMTQVINNPHSKNRFRLTPDEHAEILYLLTIPREQYLSEHRQMTKDQRQKRATLYHRATTDFKLGGVSQRLLMRRAEVINPRSQNPLHLEDRRVIMADSVYNKIKSIHERLLHGGRDKTWNEVQATCYGITREEVEWFTTHCKYCVERRPTTSKAPLQPLDTLEVGERVQVDLIDMRSEPSGVYKWILHTQDHKSRFMTLWPLIDKSAPVVADAMTYWLASGHQMKYWQSDRGGEFMGPVSILIRRYGIKIIRSRPHHPQSQGMNEQSNGHIKKRISAWKTVTGCNNWDIALAEIAQVHNHSKHSAIKMKPFEAHFNAKSCWHGENVAFRYRRYLDVEYEDGNADNVETLTQTARVLAESQGQAFDPIRAGVAEGQPLQSLQPLARLDPSYDINASENPPQQASTVQDLLEYDFNDNIDDDNDDLPSLRDLFASNRPISIVSTPSPPPLTSPPPTSPPPISPLSPTPPTERPAILRAKRNSESARQRMVLRHSRGKRVHQFEEGDVVTVKISTKDYPGHGAPPRLFALIKERKHRGFVLQTKAGILDCLQHASNLGVVNQTLIGIYAAEIHAANNTRKVTLRHAAREGRMGPELIACGCKTMPCGGRCRCKRAGVQCTIYCHGRDRPECPNNATGPAFTQKALIDPTVANN